MLRPSIFGEDLFDEMMDFPFEDEFFGKRNPLGNAVSLPGLLGRVTGLLSLPSIQTRQK